MSDEDTMITRTSIAELEARATKLHARRENAEDANQVMAYVELGRMLEVNVERCLILIEAEKRLERLEELCVAFAGDNVAIRAELTAVRSKHEALQRIQDADRARVDIIAAVMETGISKIEELAKRAETLALDVGDRD